jgi:hypothetical protein
MSVLNLLTIQIDYSQFVLFQIIPSILFKNSILLLGESGNEYFGKYNFDYSLYCI